MFDSLSRVLLWLLVGTFLYFVIRSLTAKETFLGRVVVIILLVFLLLAFILPTNGFVASIWAVLSFPLKPLGASILLLFFATQKRKDILGRNLIVGAILILLLSSVPAFAYFMTRLPRVSVAQTDRLGQDVQFMASSTDLAAQIQPAYSDDRIFQTVSLQDQGSDRLIAASSLDGQANLAAQLGLGTIPTPLDLYMLQVYTIPTQGLRAADFVPSAEMLALSTRFWERYLASIFLFLRNEQPVRLK